MNGETVYRIGYYLPGLLGARDIVVGRDPRLSELVDLLERYFSTGELSLTVKKAEGIVKKVRQAYSEGTASEISGPRVDFSAWRFVRRAGSTEPKLRLIGEADTEEKLERWKRELITLILEDQGGNT